MSSIGAADTAVRPPTGRLAPSPSGRMHAGNIYAALMAWLFAHSQGGQVLLRIEDVDEGRCRTAYADAIMRDFEALGLTWDSTPVFQHDRKDAYARALATISRQAHVYPCFCSRADIREAASAPHEHGKLVYGGTCRHLDTARVEALSRTRRPAYRVEAPDTVLSFDDVLQGPFSANPARDAGDFVVKRNDGAFAYTLAVVVDDAAMGVDQVVRGCDLMESTPQQVFLQQLLGLPMPTYIHIPLLVDSCGRRLAKRHHDAGMDELLQRYVSPAGVLGHIAYVVGLQGEDAPTTPTELLRDFDPSSFRHRRDIAWDAGADQNSCMSPDGPANQVAEPIASDRQ